MATKYRRRSSYVQARRGNAKLCLETSTAGNDLKVAECKVDTIEICKNSSVDYVTNVAQSFELRESDDRAFELMLADGSSSCVEVKSGEQASGTRVITNDCDFSA